MVHRFLVRIAQLFPPRFRGSRRGRAGLALALLLGPTFAHGQPTVRAIIHRKALEVAPVEVSASTDSESGGKAESIEQLVAEALEKNPEYAQARAALEAERQRVPQAGALPDPILSLGIQNDGFKSIEVGKMETSWYTIMASQAFPWFGKLGLRRDVATLQARQAEADLARSSLTLEADVRRAYLDLLLIRDQLGLLSKLEALWAQSEELARTRYEAGQGAQSDLLRAQLERSRLRQRRWALQSEERRRLEALNRLRVHSLDEPIQTPGTVAELPDPPMEDAAHAIADAEARSPELARAQLAAEQSGQRLALSKKDYFPDFTVSAGVMPRGGQFEPMWQAGLSFNIPIWAGSKQSRAVAESEARQRSGAQGVEAIRQLLRLRVQERLALLDALLESNRLYRSGLLVQSEATVSSTMAQYGVGRVTFASVLEALSGYLNDVNGFLESVVAAQRIAIAQKEVSLELVAGAPPGMGGASIPGTGSRGAAAASTGMPSASPAETGTAPMTRM
jgi:outer membrane protein TolC